MVLSRRTETDMLSFENKKPLNGRNGKYFT